ncbi:adenosine deaminase [Alkalilacustris brevis]|uniref:adenosine deaminase n=1 Tax=Alkalilacustris brevis TaxID=2026338 RepID=UPI000E0D43F8|nr:adenosine deaminase [Alkalilacustris brevis]
MRDLPKVELHLHLEGAAPPDLVRRIAAEHQITLARVFDEAGRYAFDDFEGFLRIYEAATSVLRTPEDYYRLTEAMLEARAEDGVIYAECFIAPDFCGGGDLGAWREYLAAIREAAENAEHRHGITLRGIATAIRHFGPDKARRAALCAAETAGDWLVGFGMGGGETRGALRDFAWGFDCAREAGLGLTVHAGEWVGPQSVRAALADLRVARIGHGVRAVEDPALVETLAETGTVLEVCPGSNIALGLYRDWAAHPVARLAEAGVAITLSTDDPPFFRTSLSLEYQRLADAFGWGADRFLEINRTAARAAFCDATTRERILQRLETPDHG